MGNVKRTSKQKPTRQPAAEDQVISDLMEKRKIQQEALIKIMTSMEKEDNMNTPLPKRSKSIL